MDKTKHNAIMASSNLNELLDADFGKVGTPSRDEFDREAEAFCLAQTLKEERLKAGLTQEELATKIGTKKNIHITTGERKSRHSVKHLIQNI